MIREKHVSVGIRCMNRKFLADKDMIEAFFWFPRRKRREISTTSKTRIIRDRMEKVCVEITSENNWFGRRIDNANNFLNLLFSDRRTEAQMDDKEVHHAPIDRDHTLPQNSRNSRTFERMNFLIFERKVTQDSIPFLTKSSHHMGKKESGIAHSGNSLEIPQL